MKMEMFQPSGSYKSRCVSIILRFSKLVTNKLVRGVGNLCLTSLQRSTPGIPIHFYSSSGGNAGLAAATTAKMLGCQCTVVVPDTTTEVMKDKIKAAGGEVIQHGESWAEADEFLRGLMGEVVGEEEQGVYCPPFDHPAIWDGNSTIIDEILDQLPPGDAPDAIVASVGGGGLLCGLAMGLSRHGLQHVPLIAVETEGAQSLSTSLKAGKNITLSKITSIATSLGCRRVAQHCFDLAIGKAGNDVRSVVLSDAQAAMACVRLLDDERIMVEAACGVSVATCYNDVIRKVVPSLNEDSKVIVIVCGGSNITFNTLVRLIFYFIIYIYSPLTVIPSTLGDRGAQENTNC